MFFPFIFIPGEKEKEKFFYNNLGVKVMIPYFIAGLNQWYVVVSLIVVNVNYIVFS